MPARPVPSVDASDLGEILDDLTDNPSHPGLRLICHGLRLIATDARLTVNDTQVLLAELAGSPDSTDILGALGHLIERLTNPDTNPALRTLPAQAQKDAAHQGQLTCHNLTDPELRTTTSEANAALDT
jgi:hypothetical protein